MWTNETNWPSGRLFALTATDLTKFPERALCWFMRDVPELHPQPMGRAAHGAPLVGYGGVIDVGKQTVTRANRVCAVIALFVILGVGVFPFGHASHVLNLIPFRDVQTTLPADQLARWFMIQLGGNVVLYVPFGIFVPLVAPALDSPWRIIPVGMALSSAVETTQYVFPLGRTASITDVLMNTVGVVCGYLLMVGIRRRLFT